MIKFKFVEFKNFLATGSHPIRIDLDQEHTTLIRGKNGTGKTTFLDAINYGLFNKPLREVKLPQLVNSVNKKNMLVTVGFDTRGKSYEVKRGQKPGIFEIYENGEKIDEDASARDLQAKLESQILRTNFKTFNQVLVIATTGYTNFMELDAPARRVVVEQMLDIQIIGHMSSLLKDRVREVRKKSSTVDNNYESTQRSIREMNTLIEQVRKSGVDEVNRIDEEIIRVDELLKQLNADLLGLREEHNNVMSAKPLIEKDKEVQRHSEANTAINEIEQNIRSITDKRSNFIGRRSEINNEVNNANREITSLNKIKDFYTKNSHCDRCNQPIDEEFRDNIVNETDEKVVEQYGILNSSEESLSKLKEEEMAMEQRKQELEDSKVEYHSVIKEVKDLVDKLKSWERQLEVVINRGKAVNQRISDSQIVKDNLLKRKQESIEAGNQDTSGYQENINKFHKELDKLAALRGEVSEEIELCKMAEMMLKDNGLKAKIIKKFLPVINGTINHYLEIMNANYSFVLDEEFKETIKSRYRDNFSYGSFSNGQRMRINLAILFSWRKLAESKNTVSSNLLIMDEILDSSLDSEGIDMLFDIFHSMENSNLFVISHRPEIVDKFDNVLEVELKGNFTSYKN